MNVTLEDLAPCKKRLKIEVPSNRVQQTFDRVTADFQKEARLPGFRAGHAPRAMVLKKYQKDIESETQRALVPEAYQEAVRSKNLRVVSQPAIEDINYIPGLSLSFSTVIELVPEFRLPAYRGLVLKKQEEAVTDEDVLKVLTNLAEQRASFVDAPDRPLEMNDFAVIAYTGTLDGQALTDLLPEAKNIGHNPNFWLWMKEEGFLPNFAHQLVGLNRTETRTIEVVFPADFPQATLAGKKAEYAVTLQEIKIKNMPPIDDAFAQELAQLNLSDLKERVRENLTEKKKADVLRSYRNEIVQQLSAAVNFDLPESVVEEETHDMVHDIVSENQARGIPANVLEENKEEIFQNAALGAREAVKFNFISSQIAEQEKITITQEDMARHLAFMAERENITLEKLVEKARKNHAFGPIQEQLLRHRVLEFLLKEAKFE